MLARQSAPLPREFCKVSACFIFNSQCGHALTVLRSLKVILNFRAHAARLVRSRSQASSTSTISPIFQSRDVTPAADFNASRLKAGIIKGAKQNGARVYELSENTGNLPTRPRVPC